MSALLTTTMREMKTTIDVIEKAGLKNQVKIDRGRSTAYGEVCQGDRCGWICPGCCLCRGRGQIFGQLIQTIKSNNITPTLTLPPRGGGVSGGKRKTKDATHWRIH